MAERENWDVLVIGSANADFLVRGERLPRPGETVQGGELIEGPGGKGANQAVAAVRLGARAALVARVGNDERGTRVVARLEAEGVDVRHVIRDAHSLTGVALVMVDASGEKQILIAPGANQRMTVHDVRALSGVIASARVVVTQLEIPMECVVEAARLGREAGASVILDPAPARPLPDDLLRLVDWIKPNATEAELLTGAPSRDRALARNAAKRLLDRGVGGVAVQAGEEGNLLVWGGGDAWLPRIPVKRVDATGAGDAFMGGLAVALAEGRSIEDAGALANAAAALATTALGAQPGLPARAEVEALAARVRAGEAEYERITDGD